MPIDISSMRTSKNEQQTVKLNASGTTLQYGNITPASSPILTSMPPPPPPRTAELMIDEPNTLHTSSNAKLNTSKKRTTNAPVVCRLNKSKKRRTNSNVLMPVAGPEPKRSSLLASHPALYLSRWVLGNDDDVLGDLAVHPPEVARSAGVRNQNNNVLQDFPHGIVDPKLMTHTTSAGPLEWKKVCGMPKSDYMSGRNIVISPTFMVLLPLGSSIELANYYPEDQHIDLIVQED